MSEQQVPLTKEAQDIFDKALALWNNTESSKRDEKWMKDVASLLALGIKKSNRPVPKAHAYLAWFLHWLNDERQARIQAEIALKHNPNEFRAQEAIVWISSPSSSSMPSADGEFGVAGALISLVFNTSKDQYSLHNFNKEITKLVNIFRNHLKSELDVDEFIYMANRLLELGDQIGDVPRTSLFALQVADKLGALPENMGRPNLFQEVAHAPTNNVITNGREQEVNSIQLAAEGRMALGKK